MKNQYIEIELLLEDISGTILSLLYYIQNPNKLYDADELLFAIQIIPELITTIKEKLYEEMIKNENFL